MMSIQSNGNVGVGTAGPSAKLEVEGSGDPLVAIDHTGVSGNPALWFLQDGAARAFVWWDEANSRLNLGTPVFNPAISIHNDGVVEFFRPITKGGGGFKIDHPLDPTNKHLWHSFVESPDMKNIYDGVTILDERGEAVVELPDWFEALNRDFRYQLTAICGAAPNLHIAEEVAGNRFRIAGGNAGMKVSWTLTGIRQDIWANAYRMPVESAKSDEDRRLEVADAPIGAL